MKYLIVSDIHGCLSRLNQVLNFFEEQKYDMLVLLGDILNYGPRNGLPEDGLDAMGIVDRLNAMSDRIVAVRGNCDSEVDQMLLSFPCLSDSALLVADGLRLFLTHGHLFSPQSKPATGIDVFCSGHTHLWGLDKDDSGCVILNTGSITFPKEGRPATFATLDEERVLRVRLLSGEPLKEIRL